LDHAKPIAVLLLKFRQSGDAATVALDGQDARSRFEERARKASWPGSDLIDALPLERTRDGRDAREQLPIEDEILPE
jgi:hypothetical protein